MQLKKLKKIIKILKDEDISEIEIEDEDGYMRVSRATTGFSQGQPAQSIESSAPHVEKEDQKEYKDESLNYIASPMVGTFYSSPTQDANPYVKLGDIIKKGQTVGIIEAMKVMNEIKSEETGEIAEVLVKNADPVEFGQWLFAIK